jgi:glyoxylase-like metal-dependent hydrolase (beta-lactamase superfamily II)
MAVNRMVAVLVFALLGGGSSPRRVEEVADFRVHVLTHAESAFVNTIIVETARRLIVIDPGPSSESAEAIVALRDSLHKPLEALLLTHAHIDHYAALYALERGGAPVVASRGIARQLESYDSLNFARFGMQVPGARTWPDRILADGQSIEVDGVTFTMFDAGPGESYDDVLWRITSGGRTIAVVGDLAMYGLPPFLQSGHSADWMASLERAGRMLPEGTRIYIGHDSGAVGKTDPSRDASILRWQRARLTAFRDVVRSITGADRLLADEEIGKVVTALHADAPENLEAFDFLITTSANVLAAELILEKQRLEFETRLRAIFAGGDGPDGGRPN